MPHPAYNVREFTKLGGNKNMLQEVTADSIRSKSSTEVRALIEEYMIMNTNLSDDTVAFLSFINIHYRTLLKTKIVSDTSWCNVKFLIYPDCVHDLTNPAFRVEGDIERKLVCYTRNATTIFVNLSAPPSIIDSSKYHVLTHISNTI